MKSRSYQIRHALLLMLTALIWGCAFVAQSVGMDYVTPMTFIWLRFLLGGIVLLPVIIMIDRFAAPLRSQELKHTMSWGNPVLRKSGLLCGIFMFCASSLQQTGLQYTSPGKAGFITTFYIIIVPLAGLILFHRKCSAVTWAAVVLSLIGLYFLSISGSTTLQIGDLFIFASSFFYAAQILTVDTYVTKVDGMKLSCIQFFVSAVLGFIGTMLTGMPAFASIRSAALPILYTGIMSTGVAYTLQIAGQRGVSPTLASMIMSLESVFATLAGFFFLGDRLTIREILGCVIMFTAIILAQLPSETEGSQEKRLE